MNQLRGINLKELLEKGGQIFGYCFNCKQYRELFYDTKDLLKCKDCFSMRVKLTHGEYTEKEKEKNG